MNMIKNINIDDNLKIDVKIQDNSNLIKKIKINEFTFIENIKISNN